MTIYKILSAASLALALIGGSVAFTPSSVEAAIQPVKPPPKTAPPQKQPPSKKHCLGPYGKNPRWICRVSFF
ncbi:MAG: hypothetical protein ABIW76_05400 [Fibrobacteria bacterium]